MYIGNLIRTINTTSLTDIVDLKKKNSIVINSFNTILQGNITP